MNIVTWNPNDKSDDIILTNNNLTAARTGGNWSNVRATRSVTNGKYYWEYIINVNSSGDVAVGVSLDTFSLSGSSANPGRNAVDGCSYRSNGVLYNNGSEISRFGESYTSGDIIGVALNMDSYEISFYKNGILQNDVVQLDHSLYDLYPTLGMWQVNEVTVNFGATPFVYSLPKGYLPYDFENSRHWFKSNKILLLTGNNKYYSFKREEDSIPNMTSNTEPKGRVTASHGENTAFNAFNDNTSSWLPEVEQNAWIQYEFPKLDNIEITNLYLTSQRMSQKGGGGAIYGGGIQDFEVYISTNGIDFKKIYENTQPDETKSNPTEYKYEINYKGVIKYIRILVKSAYPHYNGRNIGVRRIRVEYIANQMVELLDDNMSDIIINYGILPQELSEIDLSVFVGKYCINNQFTLLGSGRLFEYAIGKSNIKKITIK